MRRFGRKLDVSALRAELPLTPFFFDCLHVDGGDLLDSARRERTRRRSTDVVPRARRMPRFVTADAAQAARRSSSARSPRATRA